MKIFEGIVVSGGKNKTVVVEVSRRTPHPLYRKLMRLSKKLKADTGDLEVMIGNKVKIGETRPMSKGKYFKVLEIVPEKHVKKTVKKVEEPKEEIKAEVRKAPVKKSTGLKRSTKGKSSVAKAKEDK